MKKAIGLLLILTIVLSLAACAGSGTAPTPVATSAPPAAGDPSAKDDLPVSAPSDDDAPETGAGPGYGGRLRWVGPGDTAEAIGLPAFLAVANTTLMTPWAECLVLEATDGSIHPFLAESWDINLDDLQIYFQLRDDVYFSDGSKFNAEAVAWNINLMVELKQLNPAITGCDIIGEYEVRVNLSSYTNALLPIFASHQFCMVSMENYEKLGEEGAKNNPVGTGPFTVKEQIPGQKIVFARRDDYWQEGKPYLDEIEFFQMTDIMTQNAAVMSGSDVDRVDVLQTSIGEQIQFLGENADVHINKLATGVVCLYPSSMDEDSPLAKLEVRQAISCAIDRESIYEARGFGINTPARAFITPPFIGNFGDKNFFEYNPDKARALLAEAGYPDGFTVNFYAPASVDADSMVAIQSMLAEVGINAEVQFPETGAATDLRMNGWDGLLAGTFALLPSISSTFRSVAAGSIQYISTWRPFDLIEEPYQRGRTALVARQEDFEELHQLMLDHMVYIALYNNYNSYIINNRVHDSGWGDWGVGTMFKPWDVWVDG